MTEPEFLTEVESDAIFFIERHHSIAGAVPKDNDIIEYLKLTKGHRGINSETINALKNNRLFRASMESRGIPCNYGEGPLWQVEGLSQRQMAAAAIMLNLKDRRSDEKKLRDLGVSTEEFANWMQNATFAEYMRQRSELLISNSTHEAHMGLLRGVSQGNTASIKLYYEMTGRYNPNEENNVNIRIVIGQILEAIQKHVRDPQTLNAIAVEMSQIAISTGAATPVANPLQIAATRNEVL